jgi:hypothetical protein
MLPNFGVEIDIDATARCIGNLTIVGPFAVGLVWITMATIKRYNITQNTFLRHLQFPLKTMVKMLGFLS